MVKVSYRKIWGSNGTTYKQVVRVDKNTGKRIADYFAEVRKQLDDILKKSSIIDNDLMYTSCYLKTLENTETLDTKKSKMFFLNLTQKRYMNYILNNYRILDANTILEIMY